MSQDAQGDFELAQRQAQEEQVSRLWQDRYGLAGDPFATSNTFFFTGGQRQHHLEALTHLTAFGDMVLLVTGETGSGKTRLLAELDRQTQNRLSVCRIRSDALADPSRIPGALSRISGEALVGMEPTEAAGQFFRWTQQQAQKDRRWVLLVDDADAMSDAAISVLVNGFRSQDTGIAAVPVLAGSPELLERLPIDTSEGASGSVHEVRLAPLNQEDVRHFIQSSFDQVGGDANELLSEPVLEAITQRSGGNLRRIKQVAPALLLGLTSAGAAQPGRGDGAPGKSWLAGIRSAVPALTPRQRLWGAGVLILLGFSFFLASLYHDGDTPAEQPMPEEQAVDAEFDEVERAREVLAETESSLPEPDPVDGVDESGMAGVIDRDEPGDEQAGVEQAPPDQPEQEETPEVVEVDLPDRTEEPASDELGEAPGEDVSEEPAEPGFEPGAPEYFRDSDWHEDKSEGRYTLQLLGSFNENTAIEFVSDYDVEAMVYVRTQHQGEPWFVVLVGDYPDRDSAREAISALPDRIQELGPWARPFDDL